MLFGKSRIEINDEADIETIFIKKNPRSVITKISGVFLKEGFSFQNSNRKRFDFKKLK